MTSGSGNRDLRPHAPMHTGLKCWPGTLYALCMRSVKRDIEKNGIRVKTDTEWNRCREAVDNNNKL